MTSAVDWTLKVNYLSILSICRVRTVICNGPWMWLGVGRGVETSGVGATPRKMAWELGQHTHTHTHAHKNTGLPLLNTLEPLSKDHFMSDHPQFKTTFFFFFFFVICSIRSPWYNRHGWLGIKNQLSIYLSVLFVLSTLTNSLTNNPTRLPVVLRQPFVDFRGGLSMGGLSMGVPLCSCQDTIKENIPVSSTVRQALKLIKSQSICCRVNTNCLSKTT